jgi:hypothetical protein
MTDGFFDFGVALLRSFKKHHGESMTFLFNTRDLGESQIDRLYSLYKNLIVSNKPIDWEDLSKKTGRSISELKKYKWQVENVYVKPESVIWKQYISVEDRYRDSLQDAFSICGEGFIHLDVDSYVNRRLDPLFKIVRNNDVSLIFRGGGMRFRIFGCLMGFKFGPKADLFLETWRKKIDAVPLQKKPRGYGQTSCFIAYDTLASPLRKEGIKWGRIPKSFVSPTFSRNALIIQGNNGRRKARVAKDFLEKSQC